MESEKEPNYMYSSPELREILKKAFARAKDRNEKEVTLEDLKEVLK